MHYSPSFNRNTPTLNPHHLSSQEAPSGHTESQVTMSKIAGEYVSSGSRGLDRFSPKEYIPRQPSYNNRESSKETLLRDENLACEGTIFLTQNSVES